MLLKKNMFRRLPTDAKPALRPQQNSSIADISSSKASAKTFSKAAARAKIPSKRAMRRLAAQPSQLFSSAHASLPRGFWPLPTPLVWPNIEVAVVVFFAGGIVEASASVLGAWGGGIVQDSGLVGLARQHFTREDLISHREQQRVQRL